MAVQPGDPIPSVVVNLVQDGVQSVDTRELFADRRIVMFAVPGAFTPTCSNEHLPGYVAKLDEFTRRGCTVACLAVNDAFVMDAWSASQKVPAGLLMIADGNASFTRALGLELDGSAFGMGLRAQRFALVARDGIIEQLHVEAPGEFRVSGADAVLAALS